MISNEKMIYLAGGMSKFGKDNFDKGNEWRTYCKYSLEENCEFTYKANVINPNDYFKYKITTRRN